MLAVQQEAEVNLAGTLRPGQKFNTLTTKWKRWPDDPSMGKKIYLSLVVVALVLLAINLPIERRQTTLVDWSQLNPDLAIPAFSSMFVLGMVLMLPISV